MAEHQIFCIKKHNRLNPYERITHIGGYSNGTNWVITQERAIDYILNKQFSFYVMVDGKKVYVVVSNHHNKPYLKTENDGFEPNNLLSLPECYWL